MTQWKRRIGEGIQIRGVTKRCARKDCQKADFLFEVLHFA
jgi:hypothetical protein